jgi:hypothetical protein
MDGEALHIRPEYKEEDTSVEGSASPSKSVFL